MSTGNTIRRRRTTLVAAVCLALGGVAFAQNMAGVAHGGWTPPYPPASAGLLAGLKDLVRSPAGAPLRGHPILSAVATMNAASPAHLNLLGALKLPATFDPRAVGSVERLLAAAAVAQPLIEAEVGRRAAEVSALHHDKALAPAELDAAVGELSPFSSLPAAGARVRELARSTLFDRVQAAEIKVAAELGAPRRYEPASWPVQVALSPMVMGLGVARFAEGALSKLPLSRIFLAPMRLGLDVLHDELAPVYGAVVPGAPLGPDVYQTAKFAETSGWTHLPYNRRFEQRLRVEGTRMYTETKGSVHASVAAIRDQLRGPWNWWHNGAYERRRERPDGKISYQLWPAGKLGGAGIYVNETIYPPEPLPGGGERLRIDMEGHVNGVAYFELRPQADGTTVVLGRFAGAEISGALPRLMGTHTVSQNHLLAESGTLGFPFPSGTGWPGMITRLEGGR